MADARVPCCRVVPTLLSELAVAKSALGQGDRRHAAHHAGGAIALDPNDARALALVDDLIQDRPSSLARAWAAIRRDDDPAPVFPKSSFYGFLAVRGRAWWKRGAFDRAFRALASVQLQIPDRDFGPWILGLAGDAENAGHALDPRPYLTVFGRSAPTTVGLLHLRPGERVAYDLWAEVGARLVRMNPRHSERATLGLAASGFLRRVGRFEEALAVLGEDDAATALCQRGLALRGLGRFEEAAQQFERARRAEPDDTSYLRELGRVRYDEGKFKAALRCFKGDEDAESMIAADACRLALGKDTKRTVVQEVFGKTPTYDELRRVVMGDGMHIVMADASTNILPQLPPREPSDPPFECRVTVDTLESPSVLLTLALSFWGTVDTRELQYDAPARPTLDPIAREGQSFWQGEPLRPLPALPPPSPEVVRAVAALVVRPRHAMSEILRRARSPGVDGLPADELLAAMVHPPPPPKGVVGGQHVFDWQRACALLLASQDLDEPYRRGRRRDSLRRLVLGPSDWTTAAGLVALTEVLLDEPDAIEDARAWIDTLLTAIPPGHCPWATALRHLVTRVPRFRSDLLEPLASSLRAREG